MEKVFGIYSSRTGDLLQAPYFKREFAQETIDGAKVSATEFEIRELLWDIQAHAPIMPDQPQALTVIRGGK